MNATAKLNLASIERLKQSGLSFEDAYARIIHAAVAEEGHAPAEFKKCTQKAQYHERDDAMVALVTRQPGITRRQLQAETGLRENQIGDSLQRMMQAGRITSKRGFSSSPAKYFPGPRRNMPPDPSKLAQDGGNAVSGVNP